jgi:hypothetical protein
LKEISEYENEKFDKPKIGKLPSLNNSNSEQLLKLKKDNENLREKITSVQRKYMDSQNEIKNLKNDLNQKESSTLQSPPIQENVNEHDENCNENEINELKLELEKTKKELELKVNQTTQFQNMKKILKTKNEELKLLRQKIENE